MVAINIYYLHETKFDLAVNKVKVSSGQGNNLYILCRA